MANMVGIKREDMSPERLAEIEAREAEWSAAETERKWEQVRLKRDALMKETDWAALPDSPHATSTELLNYRQALRDLPQTYDKPEDVVWPDNPLEDK